MASSADRPLRPVAIALQAQVGQMQGRQDLAASQADAAIAEEGRLKTPVFLSSRTVRISAPAYRGDMESAAALWEEHHEALVTGAHESSVRAAYVADGAAAAAVSVMARLGDTDQSVVLRRFQALLARQLDAGDLLRLPTTLRQIALNLAEHGPLGEAAVVLTAETGFPSAPLFATADPDRHATALALIATSLDPTTSRASEALGRSMTITDAARYSQTIIEQLLQAVD